MKKFFTLILCVSSGCIALAQEKWDLRKCVEYAMQNNISVRQQDVQARLAELTLKQNKFSLFPTANLSANLGLSSGRNQDPTSFGLTTTTYLSNGYSLQTGVDLFNFFSKRNTIAASELELKAANAGVDRLRNDIALNVANAYLNVLLTAEQMRIAEVQLKQSQSQFQNTKKLVEAGSQPELSATELEAQVARDSANYIGAKATVDQNILFLKAYMNVDPAAQFEIETPPVDKIPLESIADLQPDAVYQLALQNMPLQKQNTFRLLAAQKNVLAAKGAMYPTISAFGSLGTTFNNKAQEIKGTSLVNAPIGKVDVGGTEYTVFPNSPFVNYSYGDIGYVSQLDQNFRQSVGLGISVPILNGRSLRTNYERSKLNVKTFELQQEQDNFTLKQNIFQAYNASIAALQKFEANKKTVSASERSYDFATKRYNIGLLNTIDLITSQNNLFRAKLDLVYSQFDYVFKMKVLEFYRGQGIKL